MEFGGHFSRPLEGREQILAGRNQVDGTCMAAALKTDRLVPYQEYRHCGPCRLLQLAGCRGFWGSGRRSSVSSQGLAFTTHEHVIGQIA